MHNSGFMFLATSLLLETLGILEKKGLFPVILQNLQWSHQNSEEPLLRQVPSHENKCSTLIISS